MSVRKIHTAAEVERMSPDERAWLLNDSVVTDLAELPPGFLDRVRDKGRSLLEERGVLGSTQQ